MKSTHTPLYAAIALACQMLLSLPALAQTTDPMKDAAKAAINGNPEVNARLNAYRASMGEADAAKGGFLPRVDLSSELSRVRDGNSFSPTVNAYNSTGVAVTASQLLWDGLATSSQADRLGHARVVRYFEFIDSSEQIALESTKAYVDVARARRLVKLAEDNYVQHLQVFKLIDARVTAGVGSGSDREQVTARVALAQSNLATESANLHDVTERYRRVVGALPPAQTPIDNQLDRGMPGSAEQLLKQTSLRNASLAAAVENLRSAQLQVRERESAYQPRVEARLRSGLGHNFDRNEGRRNETSAGLFLNWNLYNGGSDQARIKQQTSLLAQATDNRDKACRETRQVAAIAFNDVRTLNDQVNYLTRNVAASERTRDAYRQQFDTLSNKRSLLDVLNAENELFAARRSMTNAESDLVVAKARTHAASSSLVTVLGLADGRATNAGEPAEAVNWRAEEDAANCPISPTELGLTPMAELEARAQQVALNTNTAVAAAQAAATPVVAAAPALRTDLPRLESQGVVPLSQRLLDWSAAWTAKDVTRYLSFYDPSFKPTSGSRDAWFKNRTKLLRKDGPIALKINNVQTETLSSTKRRTQFEQVYESNGFKDKTQKTLEWKRVGADWYIVKETSR